MDLKLEGYDVFNLDPYYKVYINPSTGDVRIFTLSINKCRERKLSMMPTGYLRIMIRDNGSYKTILIHSLVAKFYLGDRPDGYCVNHKDGNKLNNRLDNLEYITREDNVRHAYATGLMKQYDEKYKYQHDWYIKNKDRVRLRNKERKLKKKQIV